jgi:hypothetical protein
VFNEERKAFSLKAELKPKIKDIEKQLTKMARAEDVNKE